VVFTDGTATDRIAVEYPIGHRRRRAEGIPLLVRKAEAALAGHFDAAASKKIMGLFPDRKKLEAMPVHAFVDCFVK